MAGKNSTGVRMSIHPKADGRVFTPAVRMELALRAAWQIESLIPQLNNVCNDNLLPAEGALAKLVLARLKTLTSMQLEALDGVDDVAPVAIEVEIAKGETKQLGIGPLGTWYCNRAGA